MRIVPLLTLTLVATAGPAWSQGSNFGAPIEPATAATAVPASMPRRESLVMKSSLENVFLELLSPRLARANAASAAGKRFNTGACR